VFIRIDFKFARILTKLKYNMNKCVHYLRSVSESVIFLVEIVKNEEMNHDVWCNSDVECWESNPEFQWSFSHGSLTHSINDVFVGVRFGLGIHFHLLHPNLHVIKWQRKESSKETSHTFSQNLGLYAVGVISISILEHFRDLGICAQLTSS